MTDKQIMRLAYFKRVQITKELIAGPYGPQERAFFQQAKNLYETAPRYSVIEREMLTFYKKLWPQAANSEAWKKHVIAEAVHMIGSVKIKKVRAARLAAKARA
jgi:hypothetical protein